MWRSVIGLSIGVFFVSVQPVLAKVNINTAPSSELQSLHGIGDTYADRIIDYRDANNSFDTLAEIKQVDGIGPATFEDIKPNITLGTNSTKKQTDDTDQEDDNPDDSSNPTATSSSQNDGDDDTTEEEGAGGGGGSTSLARESEMSLSMQVSPQTALAGSPVRFTARGIIDDHESHAAKYEWNFGDGARAYGDEMSHTYHHEGTYTVVLKAKTLEQTKRVMRTITVHEPTVVIDEIETGGDGSVVLKNTLDERVDLSDWRVTSGGETFEVPPMTYLAGGGSIAFSAETIHFDVARSGVALISPDGDRVDQYKNTKSTKPKDTIAQKRPRRAETNATPASVSEPGQSDDTGEKTETETGNDDREQNPASASPTSSTIVASAGAANQGGDTWPWVLGLAGVAGLGMMGMGLRPRGSAGRRASADGEVSNYTVRDISDE